MSFRIGIVLFCFALFCRGNKAFHLNDDYLPTSDEYDDYSTSSEYDDYSTSSEYDDYSTSSDKGIVNCHDPLPIPSLAGETWEASDNGVITIDLEKVYLVTGLVTKGDAVKNSWVKKYEVFYSESGHEYHPIIDMENQTRLFLGNYDATSSVVNLFHKVQLMRYIRLITTSNHTEKIATVMAEVLGCQKSWCFDKDILLTSSHIRGDVVFSASDKGISKKHGPNEAHWGGNGWVPVKSKQRGWLHVEFPSEQIITSLKVRTSGKHLIHVNYSRNCISYFTYSEVAVLSKMKKMDITVFKEPTRASCFNITIVSPYHASKDELKLNVQFFGCGTGEGTVAGTCGASKSTHYSHPEIENDVHRRVINGIPTNHGEWPWLVSLQKVIPDVVNFKQLHGCGGALIHPQWILTAAHCVKHIPNVESARILLGESHFALNQGTEVKMEIEKIIMHPDYVNKNLVLYKTEKENIIYGMQIYNDIALMKLRQPVKLSDYINIVCLPGPNEIFPTGTNCVHSGWGRTNASSWEDAAYPETALHTNLKLIYHEECKKMYDAIYGKGEPDTPYMEENSTDIIKGTQFKYSPKNWQQTVVCGKSPHNKIQSGCHGDSGSPLVCKNADGKWATLGIVSWGAKCGSASIPGVYTRVQAFLEWIDTEMKLNS
ncbi:uncharacterized protein LOC141906106 isoform X2 [Tubulanus polymorphus]|uniref:uncharacterized protein LOC141906106 isoform X2 n=1 Tax=Tubulanus polymorphus TaxID=672921 RepID=UPI003DA35F7E